MSNQSNFLPIYFADSSGTFELINAIESFMEFQDWSLAEENKHKMPTGNVFPIGLIFVIIFYDLIIIRRNLKQISEYYSPQCIQRRARIVHKLIAKTSHPPIAIDQKCIAVFVPFRC